MDQVKPNWKLRQKIFHLTHSCDDFIHSLPVQYDATESVVIDKAVEYFERDTYELWYPAKSYSVALLYARLLEIHFKEPFWESLDDSELLYNNDIHYKRYSDAKEVYDRILARIPINFEECKTNGVQKTIEYFLEEFNVTH